MADNQNNQRHYRNWLDAYIEYNFETESNLLFHKWTGLSMIAAVLRRKVFFNFGRIKVYPNLFIVFVAEPGIARKSQAISFGDEILTGIHGITIAADSITPQALLEDIEASAEDTVMPDGTSLRHSSLTIFSKEFESFLGQKKENHKMIITLTDLFDCSNKPFRHRTKHSGSSVLPLPYLNMLGATTPSSLADCFPARAIGGGLGSRICFIWADTKHKKKAIPELDEKREEMKIHILQDLSKIAKIKGGYNYTKESRQWWEAFYNDFEERDPNRICKDPSFIGWYSRKPIQMLKLATIHAASKSDNLFVEVKDLEYAKSTLETIEQTMGNAFSAVGRSDLTADIDTVRKILAHHGSISETNLRRMVWRDIDDSKFTAVIDTIVKGGDAKREYKNPKTGQPAIWYYWRQRKD